MKVLLILVDGMRPDALTDCEKAKKFAELSKSTMNGRTVMPSVTLPCHMSLFHSVDPLRHGTTTNTFAPQVRPINGICETLYAAGKRSAFFYNWGELRDLAKPETLSVSYFISGSKHDYGETNVILTDAAIDYIAKQEPDFTFLYLGEVDEKGHRFGWMSDEYIGAVKTSWDCIEKITNTLSDEYTVIVTADHGGHGRTHGTDMEEDMTIPLFIKGVDFESGAVFESVDIKDIAPTVNKLLGVESDPDWEGKPLF